MREPLALPADTDLVGLFEMTCPECGRQVDVRGNAMEIRIVQHERTFEVECPNSARKIVRQPRGTSCRN